MKKFLLGVFVCGAAFWGTLYFGADHQRYLAFDQTRAAWHTRCDAYVGKQDTSDEAKECARQLAAMMAYGKRQGWAEN